jgi:hypothetical protein
VACALVGCIDDFDHPKGYGTRQRIEPTDEPRTEPADCFDLCVESAGCPNVGDVGPGDCANQCSEMERLVEYAGCEDSFQDYLDCYASADACSADDVCTVEGSRLSQCFSTTCERDPASCGL